MHETYDMHLGVKKSSPVLTAAPVNMSILHSDPNAMSTISVQADEERDSAGLLPNCGRGPRPSRAAHATVPPPPVPTLLSSGSSHAAAAQAGPSWHATPAHTRSARLLLDMSRLPKAVEPLEQFFFMRNDAQMVRGLQDWTAREWIEALHDAEERQRAFEEGSADLLAVRNSIEARTVTPRRLAREFLRWSDDRYDDEGPDNLAAAIKDRLDLPNTMSEWESIVRFQNDSMNVGHPDAAIHYLSPEVLSTMLFHREFPLGVEDGIMRR